VSVSVGYMKDESLNTECLVILDEVSDDTIEVQRALKFDDQDVSLGQATYCLVRDGLAHYGGVLEWKVQGAVFTMVLDPSAASVLQLPREIELEVSHEGSQLIHDHLQKLLEMGPVAASD
jgi:hypothetical protein